MTARIPLSRPDELDPARRAVYEAISGGSRATGPFRLTDEQGRLLGPFNAMLLQPAIGDALQRLGAALRYQGELTDRCRELAILTIAAHWRSEFERDAHERVGAAAGLTAAEMAAVRTGDLVPADETERAVVAATRALLADADLGADGYERVVDVLGPARLFELTTLVGYYGLLALQMRVFGVE